MAKNSIRDYDATSGNNTDVQSVDISEGCAASGINNALREIMTDLKNVSTGAVALETPAADQLNVDNIRIDGNTISSTDTNGNVNIDPAGTGDTIIVSGSLSVGETSPLGTVHIRTSDASLTSVNGNADDLILENNGNCGMSICSSTSGEGNINFIDSGDTNIGRIQYTHSDNKMQFRVNDIVAATIDSSGKVGIGTSSPARQLEVYDDGTNGQAVLALTAQNTENSRIMFADPDDNNIGVLDYNHSDDSMRFNVNNAERLRIDNGGKLTISSYGTGNHNKWDFSGSYDATSNVAIAGNSTRLSLQAAGTQIGSIFCTATGTQYATSSDYRLKENVADMTGAITRVKQLAPKRFNFIADDSVTVDGFLAHEAQTVVPEAVNGTHNEVDDDGNAVMQGIDQSKLVPLLTGALQEAIAKIETLEAKVTALENA